MADYLDWDTFALIGHSMGAGISTLIAGTFPDRIQNLVLLEGAGPLAADASRAPSQLAKALEDEVRAAEASPRTFPDMEAAVAARLRDSDLDTGATHDPRLRTRSRVRLTENQVLAFLAAIACPVLAVRALQGWPFPEELVMARLKTIRHLQTAEIEGGHHVHLTHPERVAPVISQFLTG